MKRSLLTGLLLLIGLTGLIAEEKQFTFSPSPRFWGATLFARYSFEPPAENAVETSIIGGLSSAYETVGYYRAPDGSLFTDGVAGFSADQSTYDRFDLMWQVGLQQGILSRTDSTDDLAVVFAYYRGRYDLPFGDPDQLYVASGLPETDGGLIGSVHAGVAFSTIVDDDITATRRGIQSELVLEWGPAFLHNQVLGAADFTRTTVSGRGFLPLYASTNGDARNRISSYLAVFGALDWATGPEIPMAVRSTFGTRSERPGLGGSVRGFESRRFDAPLKAVANVEVRTNLPTIVLPAPIPALVPGFLVYTDAGYYNDLEALSPITDETSGSMLSSGAGVYVDVRGVAEIVFYSNYLWNPATIERTRWVPFSLGFGFHY